MARRKNKRRPIQAPTGEDVTPEARRHGDYDYRRVEKNGPRVAFNRAVTPLARAFHRGTITPRQYFAAEKFEAAYNVTYRQRGTRDPLDMTPRGSADDSPQEWLLRQKEICNGVMCKLTGKQSRALLLVAVYHEPLGDSRRRKFQLVSESLDIAADFLGLPKPSP